MISFEEENPPLILLNEIVSKSYSFISDSYEFVNLYLNYIFLKSNDQL